MFTFDAIGRVRSPRREATDDEWGGVTSEIALDPGAVGPDATSGLGEFSHVEVVFLFHLVRPGEVVRGTRRPRGNPEWPEVGVLAQRARARPNRIGVTVCELLAVDGPRLTVRGLDAIDGSPVLDVKPYMREFGPRGSVRQPRWATELMAQYF